MAMVDLGRELRAGQADLGGIDNHHEVAHVLMRREVGPVLSAQDTRCARRYPSQRPVGRVDQDPSAGTQGVFAGYAFGLFGQFQLSTPVTGCGRPLARRSRASEYWRGRWDLNPRLPT